jgi:hypothetical protein
MVNRFSTAAVLSPEPINTINHSSPQQISQLPLSFPEKMVSHPPSSKYELPETGHLFSDCDISSSTFWSEPQGVAGGNRGYYRASWDLDQMVS